MHNKLIIIIIHKTNLYVVTLYTLNTTVIKYIFQLKINYDFLILKHSCVTNKCKPP